MRLVFVVVMLVHGLIHLMGFVKAFGFARLPQLTRPISRSLGLVWLLACVLMIAAAATHLWAPHWFWIVGMVAVVASQVVIVTSWRDARFGSLANMVVLVGVALGFAAWGPTSQWREYQDQARAGLALAPPAQAVREEELRALPEPVQKYLRLTGAVGQPRVHNFKATWKGRIRASASEEWMPFHAEQYNFYGQLPSRLFFMQATMKHLPVTVLHRFVGDAATFRVRPLSAFTLVFAKGPEMNRSETVTLFNDLCLLAPSMLLDDSIRWEPIDAHAARAHYTRGNETITADLRFNDAGELVDFLSDDRSAASTDGTTFARQRWTTPVRDYQSFGPRRTFTRGEARWEPPAGAFAYAELELQSLAYNVMAP
jgi:hypothetical protein